MKRTATHALAVCVAALVIPGFANAQSASQWEEAKELAAKHIDSGECGRAWNVIWPWAKSGEPEARAMLAGGVFAVGLIPPGGSPDAATRIYNLLTLAVHGVASGDSATREILDGLLRSELVDAMGGRELKRCLGGDKPVAACVESAVASGFVPEFALFAQDTELAAAARGGMARCLPDHREILPARPK